MTTYSKIEQHKLEELNRLGGKDKLFTKRYKLKRTKSELDVDPGQSWDFTPFPKLYFPQEKKSILNDINKLNFPNNFNIENDINNSTKKNSTTTNSYTKYLTKNNSISDLYLEKKGDITKYRSPAFSFGISRDDCVLPFFKIKEKISPCPGSYNLRKLCGLGGGSIKYSINKEPISKHINNIKALGPGSYNINNGDTKNNGKMILSTFTNSPICNFGKYREIRGKGSHSDWFMRPDPTTYNVNSSISMFNFNGRYPLSTFKSTIGKSIDKCNSYSRNRYHKPSPGPGDYNHYSSFLGFKFS